MKHKYQISYSYDTATNGFGNADRTVTCENPLTPEDLEGLKNNLKDKTPDIKMRNVVIISIYKFE